MNICKALRRAAALLLVVISIPAHGAASFDISIDNSAVHVAPVQQATPVFPKDAVRKGQEGWVRVNFVVSTDGRVIDPIVVDSSGGGAFEKSTLEALQGWEFEAPDEARFNNSADIRFAHSGSKERASPSFSRRYRRIMSNLFYDNTDTARKEVDSAIVLGGWNLYESSMLWLMVGRVEGVEGDDAAKLEAYRRSLALGEDSIFEDKERCDLLAKLFGLEADHAQYASALRTFKELSANPAGSKESAAVRDKAAEIDQLISGKEQIAAKAAIYNPCDCDDGKPLWSYVPARRTFSFSNLSGNVERFEVRCDDERFTDDIVTDKSWSLPKDAGSCRVFVFGDDSATFEFVEHSDNVPTDEVGATAVAWGDVLDKRSSRN